MRTHFITTILLFLIFFACHNKTDKPNLNKPVQNINDSNENKPVCQFSNIFNGKKRLIQFYNDSVVWQNDTTKYFSHYGAYIALDFLRPHDKKKNYDVEFSKNYIIVSPWSISWLRGDKKSMAKNLVTFFCLDSCYRYSIDEIYSIDFKHELFVTNNYWFTGEVNTKCPLIVVKFGGKIFQTLNIEIPLGEIRKQLDTIEWNENTVNIKYFTNDLKEKNELIKIDL